MKKITVIIPAFNVELYIEQAVESLVDTREFDAMEVLIVDDGSTDRTGEICDCLASKYTNIKVIHQTNAGLSNARNKGLMLASGEYVFFLDSDDMVISEKFSEVTTVLDKSSYDVVIFDWDLVDESGNKCVEKIKHKGICEGTYSHGDFISKQILSTKYYWTIACQGFYKRDFLLCQNLLFEDGIYHEDDLWFPQVALSANSIYYIEKSVYKYRMRKNSITKDNHSKDFKHLNDIVYVYNFLYKYLTESNESRKLVKLMKKDISKRYLYSFYHYNGYMYKEIGCKIDKFSILRNSFWGDKIRAGLLLISERGYCQIMSFWRGLKYNES